MTSKEFSKMQDDVHDLKTEMTSVSKKIDIVTSALLGNDITKDGGLVARIRFLEQEKERQEKEIETLKSANTQMLVYQKIMWAACGTTAATIFAYILKLIFK